MDILKGSTAKGQRIIAMYNRDIGFDLNDVYGNYSRAKENAWDDCWDWFQNDNESSNFHICSRNSMQFTVGWSYVDPDTGHKIYRVETSQHTYRVDTEV